MWFGLILGDKFLFVMFKHILWISILIVNKVRMESHVLRSLFSCILNNLVPWLQEVDRFDDLVNFLQKDGFSGIYQVC